MFEIYQDVAGEWRWRLVAGNNEVIATGESYTRKEDAKRGVDAVIHIASIAKIVIVEPRNG